MSERHETDRRKRGLLGRASRAVRHPQRGLTYLRRAARDAVLNVRHRDHVGYYRAVMADDSARNANKAVGSANEERWNALGQMQFDYLVEHGLKPTHRMLEIGCGNLRAGWRFIDHLEPGHYYGVDISPDILVHAQRTLVRKGLQEKLPHLTMVADLRLDFLPDEHFAVAHAHSVFSHCPPAVIEECLAHIGRVLTPGGFFDFTFNRTTGAEYQVLREDYYYRTEHLLTMAEKHGFRPEFREDWEERPHRQSKIRVTKPGNAGAGVAEHH
ncbi:class I SAM-dependent methyltransferase [Spiractinospora alimapuensis]|uniref:class I SAM-dependent methyltransferase n=1 Tax=Spiractinospora alimapuensis TaxID=2820884 RepID=UPI001F39238F|nr:class I SAM-dependent methyltransferase [Spiractinospora alimapuensis]QVQ52482.1 class I SAM-dependent methyltransferase [Spiractinospora alimapuensis]